MPQESGWLSVFVTLLLGIGGGGGLVALLRIRVDRQQIIVTAAQGAVIVQSTLIDDLREQIAWLKEENRSMHDRIAALEVERDRGQASSPNA